MKLTEKHYKLFQNYCFEYQKKFELMNWNIAFEFKKLGDGRAQAAFDLEAHNVTLGLNTEWNETVVKYSDEKLKDTAKHEMLHVLLARLGELGQYRYVMQRELVAAEHEVIQKLLVLIK